MHISLETNCALGYFVGQRGTGTYVGGQTQLIGRGSNDCHNQARAVHPFYSFKLAAFNYSPQNTSNMSWQRSCAKWLYTPMYSNCETIAIFYLNLSGCLILKKEPPEQIRIPRYLLLALQITDWPTRLTKYTNPPFVRSQRRASSIFIWMASFIGTPATSIYPWLAR